MKNNWQVNQNKKTKNNKAWPNSKDQRQTWTKGSLVTGKNKTKEWTNQTLIKVTPGHRENILINSYKIKKMIFY